MLNLLVYESFIKKKKNGVSVCEGEKRGGIALITWLLEESFFLFFFLSQIGVVDSQSQLSQFNQTSWRPSNLVNDPWLVSDTGFLLFLFFCYFFLKFLKNLNLCLLKFWLWCENIISENNVYFFRTLHDCTVSFELQNDHVASFFLLYALVWISWH